MPRRIRRPGGQVRLVPGVPGHHPDVGAEFDEVQQGARPLGQRTAVRRCASRSHWSGGSGVRPVRYRRIRCAICVNRRDRQTECRRR